MEEKDKPKDADEPGVNEELESGDGTVEMTATEEAASQSDELQPEPEGAKTVELGLRSIFLGVGVVLVAITAGVGAYFVGKGSGEDLQAARTSGVAAGTKAGKAKGTRKGFVAGTKIGKKKGFQKAYGPTYKKAYTDAYDDAGLTAPKKSEIKIPKS